MKKIKNLTLENILIYIVIIGILAFALFIVGFSIYYGAKSENYAITTTVTAIQNDEVVCADFNGNEWKFTGAEDWKIGDIASMIINDNGTEIITDDNIISIHYSGYVK